MSAVVVSEEREVYMTATRFSTEHPLISVVIPTYNRPELLRERALQSALNQTYPNVEIIVVLDGQDGKTPAMLEAVGPQVTLVALSEQGGVSAARNAGVRHSRGEWIAFLDDDDEWRPDKLWEQAATARRSVHEFPVVFNGYIGRTPAGDRLHPSRPLEDSEPIGDYLMVRRTLKDEECVLVSSLFFAPRALMLNVPFKEGLKSQEDWDWLLRAEQVPGVGFDQVPREKASSLTIYYSGEARPSGSRHLIWEDNLHWAREHWQASRLSDRAFAGFLLFQLAPRASAAGDYRGLAVLGRSLLSARPTALELLRFLKHALLPAPFRRMLRNTVNAVRPTRRL
ncbi:glycosyltransferase family 2 protein [Deinococcus metalli]